MKEFSSFIILLLISSCSPGGRDNSSLSLTLPLVAQSALNSDSPLEVINCYAIAVGDELVSPSCFNDLKEKIFQADLYFGPYQNGETINLEIPSGPQKMISLIGWKQKNSTTCQSLLQLPLSKRVDFEFLSMLSSTTVDLIPGETMTINFTRSFESKNLIAMCPHAPFLWERAGVFDTDKFDHALFGI